MNAEVYCNIAIGFLLFLKYFILLMVFSVLFLSAYSSFRFYGNMSMIGELSQYFTKLTVGNRFSKYHGFGNFSIIRNCYQFAFFSLFFSVIAISIISEYMECYSR